MAGPGERLFRAMDALLAAAPAARARGLHVRTFHVAPLSLRCGLLEFVVGTSKYIHSQASARSVSM